MTATHSWHPVSSPSRWWMWGTLYVCTLPTSSTSSYFYFHLFYPLLTLPHTHPSLFPPSPHPLTLPSLHSPPYHPWLPILTLLTLLTLLTQTLRIVSSDGVGIGCQTKETAPPPHTLTQRAKLEWIWSVIHIRIVHCCVCGTSVWDDCQ